jgi:hypothetical protein
MARTVTPRTQIPATVILSSTPRELADSSQQYAPHDGP